ncbi:MAG TPA: DUF5683 domain-containing protein [Chitinophagaceae bacterium]|nr:DUF5683 domain-containing protein [Chitinophagaceae bacterium]
MIFQDKVLFTVALVFCGYTISAQEDSASARKDTSLFVQGEVARKVVDTIPRHNPRKAAIRSAIIPGWGQIYNKKYWKVPIVYTAIGIPAGLFFYNKAWYDRTNYAYAVSLSPNPSQDSLNKVHPDLLPLVERNASSSLVNYRNDFRRNMDYCVIFFLLAWALNVVDATVDAHLKEFNVSPDLSLKFKPVLSNNNYGIGLVLDLHSPRNSSK